MILVERDTYVCVRYYVTNQLILPFLCECGGGKFSVISVLTIQDLKVDHIIILANAQVMLNMLPDNSLYFHLCIFGATINF